MNNFYKVLIIPAGSGMAISAIMKLNEDNNIQTIAADVDKLAPGLHIADKGYIVPSFSDPSFFDSILSLIKKEKINVLIPALDTILLDFSKRKKEFLEYGVKILVSEPEVIRISRDKWLSYLHLKDTVPFPCSCNKIEDITKNFPLFIKPRKGSGSIDAHKIKSQEQLDFYFGSIDEPIIQEFLPGKEYTVDCLADKDGNLVVHIPRERIETKCGISTKGKVVKNWKIEEIAEKLAKTMNFFGPFFFQLKEDNSGNLKIMEINPRISGTMSLSAAAGANIHSLAVRIAMGESIEVPKIKEGIYVTRHWNDIYLNENDLTNINTI